MYVYCLKQSFFYFEFVKELFGFYKQLKNVFIFFFVVICMSYLYLWKWYICLYIELIVDCKSLELIKIFFYGSFCMKINFISECVYYLDVSYYREQKIFNGFLYIIFKVCFFEMEINILI